MVCYIINICYFHIKFLSKGLSDPYCKVSVVHNPSNSDDSNGLTLSQTSPSHVKQTASLFSCASAPCI
jgi:hypothetical protein